MKVSANEGRAPRKLVFIGLCRVPPNWCEVKVSANEGRAHVTFCIGHFRNFTSSLPFVFFPLTLKPYLWSRIGERGLSRASFFGFQAVTGLIAVFAGLIPQISVLMPGSFKPMPGHLRGQFLHFLVSPRRSKPLGRRKIKVLRHTQPRYLNRGQQADWPQTLDATKSRS